MKTRNLMTNAPISPSSILKEIKNKSERSNYNDPNTTNPKSNDFPLSIFPSRIQAIIEENNKALNYPIPFFASSILAACSISLGNNARIKVMEGWTEIARLYLVLVGNPGTNKTSPLKAAFKPLNDIDKEHYDTYNRMKAEYESSTDENAIKPTCKKTIISDVTPESIIQTHKFNPRGLGLVVDEYSSIASMGGRYSNSNSFTELLLSSWSGSPIIVDRKGGETTRIDNPYLSMVGTTQPETLKRISKGANTTNGFHERQLFVYPSDLKAKAWSTYNLDSSLTLAYTDLINSLYLIDECELTFTSSAMDKLIKWQSDNTKLVNQANNHSNSGIAGVYSKLDIYCIRFCLLIELIDHVCSDANGHDLQIRDESVEKAIKLTEYFRKESIKVYDLLFDSDPIEQESDLFQKFYRSLPPVFQTNQAVSIGAKFQIPRRTIEDYLKKKRNIFKKIKHGTYEKTTE